MRIKKTNRERGIHMGHTGRNSMSSVVGRPHGGGRVRERLHLQTPGEV